MAQTIQVRTVGVLAAVLIVFSAMLPLAAPSHAALLPTCSVGVSSVTTNGVTAYGTGVTSCTNGNPYAIKIQTRVQRAQLVGWASGSWFPRTLSSPQVSVSTKASMNCNGTGTKKHRTHAIGGDYMGGTATVYSAGNNITC